MLEGLAALPDFYRMFWGGKNPPASVVPGGVLGNGNYWEMKKNNPDRVQSPVGVTKRIMKNSRDIPLEHGGYYHVYNRGNNGEQLFYTPENYYHFLRLYEKYIDPIADTYAWCLMGNHFHLLIRMKEEGEIDLNSLPNPVRVSNPDRVKRIKPPHRYFSDLFNSYCQAINKQQKRTGSLFESPFHRIPIDSDKYFRNLVVYIHQNPVHHGFSDNFRDYPWSSYGSVLVDKPTKIRRSEVLNWFDGQENFINVHAQLVDNSLIEHLVKE